MTSAPRNSAAPRSVKTEKKEERFVPDIICGACPHCSRKGVATQLSFQVGIFPTPSGQTYGCRMRVPFAPAASAYLGVCPKCGYGISVGFVTVNPDAKELRLWKEAQEANKHDSMFSALHPMPCQKYYTNGFF